MEDSPGPDPLRNDPASRLAASLFCQLRGWKPGQLAKAVGMSHSQMSRYAQGHQRIPRKVLERMADATGFPRDLIDPLLAGLRSLVAALKGRGRPAGLLPLGAAAELTGLLRQAAGLVLAAAGRASHAAVPPSAEQARRETAALWEVLKASSAEDHRLFVEELEEYQTPALCERVCLESVHALANDPALALELAELAAAIADRVAGGVALRRRLQGYAGIHVANTFRAFSIPRADEVFARALVLWKAGAGGDRGFLNEAWVPGLEAALRRDQRRFPEALERIEEALALDRGELRAEILMTKAGIHAALGQPEASTAALLEAVPLIDPEGQPRLAFGLRYNLLSDLACLERFTEVEEKLPDVRTLAERLGGELDLTRVSWLEAKVAAGLKRTGPAEAGFEHVRQVFRDRGLTFDYALATLELSLLLLELGRTAEVKRLAAEMLRIFAEQEVEREALAALRVFCEAAKREAATVELTRRVMKFLYRAQHDPGLRFDTEEEAPAYSPSER